MNWQTITDKQGIVQHKLVNDKLIITVQEGSDGQFYYKVRWPISFETKQPIKETQPTFASTLDKSVVQPDFIHDAEEKARSMVQRYGKGEAKRLALSYLKTYTRLKTTKQTSEKQWYWVTIVAAINNISEPDPHDYIHYKEDEHWRDLPYTDLDSVKKHCESLRYLKD